jgi:hypothetical protein
MKPLLSFASLLGLAASVQLSQTQTPATPHDNPTPAKPTTTADQRAAHYQGPKVAKDSKALGQKMVRKSKPADMNTRIPVK